jgi:hypothetical protein
MKSRSKLFVVCASVGLLSLLSFSAIAESCTCATLKEAIQTNAEKQYTAEIQKYARIVSLAGSRRNELAMRKAEVSNAYNGLNDLISAVMSHGPTSQDYKNIAVAAATYSAARGAFIDLQKSILARNGVPPEVVATKRIYAAPISIGMN